jgi:short-subunit dehydrogenase
MNIDFKAKYGEWALITGATSGIGKALAYEIAAKGINIVLVARSKENIEIVSKSIEKEYKVSVAGVSADLSAGEGVNEVISKTENLRIGFLILSAGQDNTGFFPENKLETELNLIQLNIVSTLKLTHHFSRKMLEHKRGGILLISSLTALMPTPYYSNYAATKSYVQNLACSLYGELKPYGIDVSVLAPGVTDTPMAANTGIDWSATPVKSMKPETVADETIKQFGKKLLIVPGQTNKIFVFIMKFFSSPAEIAVRNEKMLKKAARKYLSLKN